MSAKHKEQLASHRDKLVANMYPDDVLNRLQSRKVLNARDVSRIRDKTQIDGQVELLLDTLMRKPDRAFAELISALVATDQKHVAKLLEGLLWMISRDVNFVLSQKSIFVLKKSICFRLSNFGFVASLTVLMLQSHYVLTRT